MAAKIERAMVVGAGRGTGRAVALKLASAGTKVTAVARTMLELESLVAENANITPYVSDGADGIAVQLIGEIQPSLLVLAGGITPKIGTFPDQGWESFGGTWNPDTKIAFEFLRAAIEAPLLPGSTLVTFSSSAANSAASLSVGHGRAKRMQHYLTDYTAWEAERRGLDLRCFTIYPRQQMAGTKAADIAFRTYAKARSVPQNRVSVPWVAPLTPDLLADRMAELVDDDAAHLPGAWDVTGAEMMPLN